MAYNAVNIRRTELLVLAIGTLVALFIMVLDAPSAFRANMAGGYELVGFLLTVVSFVFMGAIVASPFIVLARQGKKIADTGPVNAYQKLGLVISGLTTCASIYLYIDAYFVVSTDTSSTAGLVFLAVPIILLLFGGGSYRLLVFIYEWKQRKVGR